MDAERETQIETMIRAGSSATAIRKAMRCGRELIERICVQRGIRCQSKVNAISASKVQVILQRLKAGDKFKRIAAEEHVGRDTVKKLCRQHNARPMPPKRGRPYGKSLYIPGGVNYEEAEPYKCERNHRTNLVPCPVCIAEDAIARTCRERVQTAQVIYSS